MKFLTGVVCHTAIDETPEWHFGGILAEGTDFSVQAHGSSYMRVHIRCVLKALPFMGLDVQERVLALQDENEKEMKESTA